MAELLFEIGCEEIPAGYLAIAEEWLYENCEKRFRAVGLLETDAALKVYTAPRRIAIMLKGVLERQADRLEIISGPPKKIAYDDKGDPTPAALGFAKKNNIPTEELDIEGEFVVAKKLHKGRSADEVVPEVIVQLLQAIPFPKTMRWGEGDDAFTRPVHWLLCLLGEKPLKFSFAGVESDDRSFGHRFLAPAAVKIKSPAEYLAALKRAFVIADKVERTELIRKEAAMLAEKEGFICNPDEKLLNEVANLVEFPVVIMGKFDEKYLELPEEALITSMATHQRYFAVRKKDSSLADRFITVSNTRVPDIRPVIEGNGRVLRARLEDARFFFAEDRKKKLSELAIKLKDVVYHKRLGSYRDKVERLKALIPPLSKSLGNQSAVPDALRSAELCKADLLTAMVYEFPELQGIMGREYARRQGEKSEVAQAIFEHYLPRGLGDKIPETPAGTLLALAEKLDTIIACFGANLKPSGSQDPFALRRACLGVIRILEQNDKELAEEVVKNHIALTKQRLEEKKLKYEEPEKVYGEIAEFFKGRLLANLRQEFRTDLVSAVVEVNWRRPKTAYLLLKGLSEVAGDAEFIPLVIAFKRSVNILKQASERGYPFQPLADEALFSDDGERALHSVYAKLKADVDALVAKRDYTGAFKTIVASLYKPLDDFFIKVMVMVEDEKQRGNRLALLSEIAEIFQRLADFSLIHTEVGK